MVFHGKSSHNGVNAVFGCTNVCSHAFFLPSIKNSNVFINAQTGIAQTFILSQICESLGGTLWIITPISAMNDVSILWGIFFGELYSWQCFCWWSQWHHKRKFLLASESARRRVLAWFASYLKAQARNSHG